MKIKHFRFLSGIAALLMVAGCAGPFRFSKPLAPVSAHELLSQVARHASQVKTFEGRAQMSAASEGGSFRGTLRVVMKAPDSLWFKIEGPLGVDLAAGRSGGGNALFFSPWENIAYQGPLEELQQLGLIPFDMGSADLVLGVLGLVVPENVNDSCRVSVEGRRYALRHRAHESVLIDPKGPVVTRWDVRDSAGEVEWVWQGREFSKHRGVRLPAVIQLTATQPKQRLTLVYETVKINQKVKSDWFRLTIPEGVNSIEL